MPIIFVRNLFCVQFVSLCTSRRPLFILLHWWYNSKKPLALPLGCNKNWEERILCCLISTWWTSWTENIQKGHWFLSVRLNRVKYFHRGCLSHWQKNIFYFCFADHRLIICTFLKLYKAVHSRTLLSENLLTQTPISH